MSTKGTKVEVNAFLIKNSGHTSADFEIAFFFFLAVKRLQRK